MEKDGTFAGVGERVSAEELLFPAHRAFEMEFAGRKLTVDVGRLAKQANGSAVVRYGDTMILATATSSSEPREGVDFFPLTVDYEERQYAAGRIPGNFFRREGRPTEKAILAARLIDRSIRPMFPKSYRNDVQVIVTVLSVDHDNAPEICGIIGSSVALCVSDIPFEGPVAAVIVGMVDGKFVINPTSSESERSEMHLVVAGTRDAVVMVEAGAREVAEETMLDAISFAHENILQLIEFQGRIASEMGRDKQQVVEKEIDPELERRIRDMTTGRIEEAISIGEKLKREEAIAGIKTEIVNSLIEEYPEQEETIDVVFKQLLKEVVRRMILDEGKRPDGRALDEIRPIYCDVGLVPRAHGSGLFTRGQTQVLTAATLGTVGDVQMLDSLEEEDFKRYIHHYNFPPFSVGEARPLRGPSRRDIGHGALAERALEPVLPDEDGFPYTIRLVSEILESNGSTSMASVCGSTLALMDAGVPIRAPVAGIAMGLVMESERVAILSDIQGIEDALGDMDFKVAGTERGITALQMDVKIKGVTREILARALAQAREGRVFILKKMLEVISEPRKELSPYAPRIIVVDIDPEKIRDVIGPGGKMINKIIGETNTQIDIEDDGRVFIAASSEEDGKRALKMIQDLTEDVVVGKTYTGKVVRIMNFGAFVEILPGKEGLVHISQLSDKRVGRVEDVVSVGDEMPVKVIEIDNLGRINLSRKEALKEAAVKGDKGEGLGMNPSREGVVGAVQPDVGKMDFRRPFMRGRRRRTRR